jgi:hypothetical protein
VVCTFAARLPFPLGLSDVIGEVPAEACRTEVCCAGNKKSMVARAGRRRIAVRWLSRYFEKALPPGTAISLARNIVPTTRRREANAKAAPVSRSYVLMRVGNSRPSPRANRDPFAVEHSRHVGSFVGVTFVISLRSGRSRSH